MLNQISIEDRALFLELFTKELIIHSKTKKESEPEPVKEKTVKKKKSSEELKINPLIASEFNIQEEINNSNQAIYNEQDTRDKMRLELNLPEITPTQEFKKEIAQVKAAKTYKAKKMMPPSRKTMQPLHFFPKTRRVSQPPTQLKSSFTTSINTQNPHIPSTIIAPIPGIEIDLGKLNMLAIDKGITVIECPGPEKFVLVKKTGKVNLTRIKLSQEEINSIISAFSEKARIPLIEGVFKAIVGEISINAIITDSLCHRFMIYKKSPYSLIESESR